MRERNAGLRACWTKTGLLAKSGKESLPVNAYTPLPVSRSFEACSSSAVSQALSVPSSRYAASTTSMAVAARIPLTRLIAAHDSDFSVRWAARLGSIAREAAALGNPRARFTYVNKRSAAVCFARAILLMHEAGYWIVSGQV